MAWRRPRRPRLPRRVDDDLLSGFAREGSSGPQLRSFFAVTVSGSVLAWDITFALGAYHTVFYSRLFDILVVSTALLLGAIALREVRVRGWMLAVLVVPLVWVGFRLATTAEQPDSWLHPVDVVLSWLVVATLPFITLAVIRIIAPEYFALPGRRLKIIAVAIVLVIALAGFLAGAFNYRIVTCHSFVIAGDDTPANCQQSPPPHP